MHQAIILCFLLHGCPAGSHVHACKCPQRHCSRPSCWGLTTLPSKHTGNNQEPPHCMKHLTAAPRYRVHARQRGRGCGCLQKRIRIRSVLASYRKRELTLSQLKSLLPGSKVLDSRLATFLSLVQHCQCFFRLQRAAAYQCDVILAHRVGGDVIAQRC